MEWRGCERKIFHQPSFSPSRRFPRRVENPGRPGPEHLGGVGGGAAAGLSVACPQADVGTRGKNRPTRKIQISRRPERFSAFESCIFCQECLLMLRIRFPQVAECPDWRFWKSSLRCPSSLQPAEVRPFVARIPCHLKPHSLRSWKMLYILSQTLLATVGLFDT